MNYGVDRLKLVLRRANVFDLAFELLDLPEAFHLFLSDRVEGDLLGGLRDGFFERGGAIAHKPHGLLLDGVFDPDPAFGFYLGLDGFDLLIFGENDLLLGLEFIPARGSGADGRRGPDPRWTWSKNKPVTLGVFLNPLLDMRILDLLFPEA